MVVALMCFYPSADGLKVMAFIISQPSVICTILVFFFFGGKLGSLYYYRSYRRVFGVLVDFNVDMIFY